MNDNSWYGNDIIFKTYVMGNSSGDGKHPLEKVKGRNHIHDWKEVEGRDCYGAILNDDFIDISFDDTGMFGAFLHMAEHNEWRCMALPSPHGGHTYWRKPRIKQIRNGAVKKTAVGFEVDIHSGSTYIPLCVHGRVRFPPVYDILDGEEYQEVPEELWPVGKTDVSLWQLDAGEGRNNELFKYILTLQKLQISNDVIRRVISNSNQFVLKSPLDAAELDTILRDEAFSVPNFFNENNTFLFDKFARYLVDTQHFVKISGQLHVYSDGVYESGQDVIERKMIEIIPNLKAAQRMEVRKYMTLIAPSIEQADARYIAFRNGIYDCVTQKVTEFTPDLCVTNKINLIYDPEYYSGLGDQTLSAMANGDPSIRALLEECVGYCMYRQNTMRKAFILTGGKRNGKSTFLDWLKNTLGDANICALDLKELSDRFSTAMMYGKLANIGDDIGDDFLQGSQVAIFKKIVAGNRIKAEQKGQDPFEFNPYCKLLFSANDIPRMKDKTGAVLDRLIIIPFDAVFEEGRPGYNKHIGSQLRSEDARMYLVRVGIEGLQRILADGSEFTKSEKVERQMKEYQEENNPIIGYIHETDIRDICNEPTADVYRRYTVFCAENNMTPMSKIQFSKVIKKELDLDIVSKRVNGRKSQIFVRRRNDDPEN